MGMRLQSLSPGVQDAEESDLGAQTLRIGRHFQKSRGHGIEQERKQEFFVLPHEWNQCVRNAKHEVVVNDGQQLLLPTSQPLLSGIGLALRAMAVTTTIE